MATPDIICLGEALVEFNEREPGVFQQGFGGDTSNCAIAAARQGAAVGYLSAVGEDAFGERLLALWHEEGVDATHVVRDRRHATGHYFVTHDEKGHAFTYHRAGSAASHMTPAMLPREYLAGAKLLQISAISQAIGHEARGTVDAAMAIAREAGVRIAYDTNLRLKLWSLHRAQEVIHASLTGCDIALPGLDDARRLTGVAQPEAIVDLYRSLGPELVVLTLGGDGVLVADGERRERIPGHEVQSVDTTAAGDTFDGAFLAMLCAGADPVQAARHANAAAALATTGYGAVAPMPTRKQVDDFLANQKNQKGTESF